MNDFESFANEVVGPIRVSAARKSAIREELLNHLSESAERARENGVNPDDLTSHALERFGDVEMVRSQIEASIPAWQRMLFVRILDRRDDESDVRYGARISGYASTLIAAFVFVCIGAHWAEHGVAANAMLWLLMGPPVAFVFLTGTFLLDVRIRRQVQRGGWRTAIVAAVLEGAALGMVPVVSSIAAEAVAPGIPYTIAIGAVIGVTLFVVFVPASLASAYWYARKCPWIEDLGRDI